MKSLTLLEYLIKNGSDKVVDHAKDQTYHLKSLKNYHHIDEKGKDQGINGENSLIFSEEQGEGNSQSIRR